jgi:hypothetical protein
VCARNFTLQVPSADKPNVFEPIYMEGSPVCAATHIGITDLIQEANVHIHVDHKNAVLGSPTFVGIRAKNDIIATHEKPVVLKRYFHQASWESFVKLKSRSVSRCCFVRFSTDIRARGEMV